MMYLTKIEMPLQSRKTAERLQNAQKMHELVTGLFQCARVQQNILFRVHTAGGKVVLYLYADGPVQNQPAGVTVCGQRDLTDWMRQFRAGQAFSFDLLAAPMKKVRQNNGGNSQRRVLRTQEERLAWLNRKAKQNGFSLRQVTEQEQRHYFGRHGRAGGTMHLDAYHYLGILCVEDADWFRQALSKGIGSGRAYGLGMMMVNGYA